MNTTSKIMIAALTGAAAGAITALLYAPASGKETRDLLRDKLATAKDTIDDLLHQGKNVANGAAKKVKDEVTKGKEELSRASQSHA